MKVLLIGSGGREHALAWKIVQSPLCDKLFCAPGNAGIAQVAECTTLDVTDHPAVIDFCHNNEIGFVVVGPEAPLVAGLVDDLEEAGIDAFGPSAYAAQLEGSKGFTKDLCAEFVIPTAAYKRFTDAESAKAFLDEMSLPVVVKADGLAAGKGVIIAETRDEAIAGIDACFEGSFGEAGHEVVIEEFLVGEEASLFALCDGQTALMLGTAQDHKRVGDGDTGPNTGGMGAYSPAPVMTQELIDRTMAEIIVPTLAGMHARGAPFRGILYAGLMITNKGPELIEYNVRFGDPECQVLMLRLKSDLLELMQAASNGSMLEVEADWHNDPALTVVMASNGYPGSYEKGTPIAGIDKAEADGAMVFHAGTSEDAGGLKAIGGRVLNVTARGASVREAQRNAYDALSKIEWDNGFYRKDIGWRAIERES
ncbi:MAG: phosphoribosylamine--glycine ligase [Rhizobiaceae bacterium]|nr:phosphoribosylamine--glycine ligase [Rhizobiaceae bacterium]